MKIEIDKDTYRYVLKLIRNLKGYKREREDIRNNIIDSSPRNV